MRVRVVPFAGDAFEASVHAYNHHRRQLWLRRPAPRAPRAPGAAGACHLTMIRTSAVERLEILKDRPRSPGATIEAHFGGLPCQPQALSAADVDAQWASRAGAREAQAALFAQRAVAGTLFGLGALVAFKLAGAFPGQVRVDADRAIHVGGVAVHRPYGPGSCKLVGADGVSLSAVKHLVEAANGEYDRCSRGG